MIDADLIENFIAFRIFGWQLNILAYIYFCHDRNNINHSIVKCRRLMWAIAAAASTNTNTTTTTTAATIAACACICRSIEFIELINKFFENKQKQKLQTKSNDQIKLRREKERGGGNVSNKP